MFCVDSSCRRLERAINRAKDEKGMADLMSLVNLFVVGGARAFESWRVFKKGKRTSVLGLGTAVQNTVDRSRYRSNVVPMNDSGTTFAVLLG